MAITNTKINGPTIFTGQRILSLVRTAVSYVALATDEFIEVTASGPIIVLPSAVGIGGQQYTIKLTAVGFCTVVASSGQTIDGSSDCFLSGQYSYVRVLSNGINWIIIGGGGSTLSYYYGNLY